MTRLIRIAASFGLLLALSSVAFADPPTAAQCRTEMAEYKAKLAAMGDTEAVATINELEQATAADDTVLPVLWPRMKANFDKAIEKLSNVEAPEPGTFVFSKSDGGPPATKFTLGKDKIFGRLEMKAPIKAFNQAYARPPGSEDYDHGDAMLKVSVDGKPFFEGRAQLWDAEYETATTLPFAVLPGDAEVPVYTKSGTKTNGKLWVDENTGKIFAESFLSLVYDAIPEGTHTVIVDLFAKQGYGHYPAIASGSFELEVTAAGKKALAKASKRTAPKKAGGAWSKIDKQLTGLMQKSDAFKDAGIKVLFARTQTKWNETLHPLTKRVTKRYIKADVAYKTADGQCRITQGVKFCQESKRDGGGAPFTFLDQCSSLTMDQLGLNTYAIPCSKVR